MPERTAQASGLRPDLVNIFVVDLSLGTRNMLTEFSTKAKHFKKVFSG